MVREDFQGLAALAGARAAQANPRFNYPQVQRIGLPD